jgi:3-hydroxyisobutyrate dehydrogenase
VAVRRRPSLDLRNRGPLLAAGASAQACISEFVELGAPVRTLPQAQAGDAAALKLLRTILTKGLESLAVECLVAADRQGVRSELYEAMSDVDEVGFTNFLDMLVRTHVQHSERRMHEVERAEAVAEHRPPAAAATDVTEALKWLSTTASSI